MSHTTLEFSSIVLKGHHDSVNAVKFDADLSMLLSGDNSGHIIVWDLGSHEPLQTIDASFAGSATSLCWINTLKDGTTDENASPAFAVGFGTGIIAIYRQSSENHLFEFVKNIEAHDGPVEDLAFDRFFLRLASAGAGYPQVWSLGSPDILHRVSPPQSGFRPYICKGVHFTDRGESLVVTYTESHTVMKYIVEPWTFKSSRLLQTRIGFSFVDGDSLFVSNLSNGVDLYSLRTMQRLRHYEVPVTINMPLQVALARQNLDRVVVGGIDGSVRVYDRTTGELVHRLGHKVKGRVQVVDAASTPEMELIAVASTSIGQDSMIQLWHLKGSPKSSQAVLTHSHPPKAGYLQQAWRWLRFMFIVVVINAFLIYLLLQFIIIPYLVEVGDLRIVSVAEVFSPIPSHTSVTPSLSQDIHTVIYL